MTSATKVFIVAAKRTPFGSFGGSLKNVSANLLGAVAAKSALQQLGSTDIPLDSVIFGNVAQTSNDAAYLARHVALRAGLPISVPALTINRLCGSGFEAASLGSTAIRAGDANLVLVGGAENMSMSPFAFREVRWGLRYGKDAVAEDTLAAALVDRYPSPPVPMGITAERLASKHNISRTECDTYALRSHHCYAKALADGLFASEICEVPLDKGKNGSSKLLNTDEHPRCDATMGALASLPPVFLKDGVVTAGNASGISDGAAALILASQSAVNKYGLKPLARICDAVAVGVEPGEMGIGPVPAVNMLLRRAGLQFSQIGIFEINEAFAAQYLAVERELGLNRDITNRNGGAIALGHPLAASGARILGHLCYEMNRTQTQFAVGAACIGGGQGIAVLLELP